MSSLMGKKHVLYDQTYLIWQHEKKNPYGKIPSHTDGQEAKLAAKMSSFSGEEHRNREAYDYASAWRDYLFLGQIVAQVHRWS